MRNLILGLSLSVAFIIGCLVQPYIEAPVRARARTNVQKWEYKCFQAYKTVNVEAKANRLGRVGFDLVGANGSGNMASYNSWCFKRRLP